MQIKAEPDFPRFDEASKETRSRLIQINARTAETRGSYEVAHSATHFKQGDCHAVHNDQPIHW